MVARKSFYRVIQGQEIQAALEYQSESGDRIDRESLTIHLVCRTGSYPSNIDADDIGEKNGTEELQLPSANHY
ncbi:hypothetical protein A988_21207 [Pseudomonas syringae BRIP39023]|nr:hypothetical protein A988_21207 [Pseudomonas syringae BRIP39023]PBQ16916.1 hypothetical protein CCL09_14535 [Pseudomonas congelans]